MHFTIGSFFLLSNTIGSHPFYQLFTHPRWKKEKKTIMIYENITNIHLIKERLYVINTKTGIKKDQACDAVDLNIGIYHWMPRWFWVVFSVAAHLNARPLPILPTAIQFPLSLSSLCGVHWRSGWVSTSLPLFWELFVLRKAWHVPCLLELPSLYNFSSLFTLGPH